MVQKIIAAHGDDSVMDIAKLMMERDLNGLPIVDENNRLLGMVTTKELLNSKGLYLPTLINVFSEIKVLHSSDVSSVTGNLKSLRTLKAASIMNRRPVTLKPSINLEEAAEAFLLRHEDLMAVVDEHQTLLGVVSKYDILRAITKPLQPVQLHSEIREELEPVSAVEDIEKKFVVVSRTRARFWYFALLVFLAIGIVVAIALIIRVRIL